MQRGVIQDIRSVRPAFPDEVMCSCPPRQLTAVGEFGPVLMNKKTALKKGGRTGGERRTGLEERGRGGGGKGKGKERDGGGVVLQCQ